jgi:predicted transcriptional regulator
MAEDVERAFKCTVPSDVAARIEELAERMGMSSTRMASLLLEAGLEDEEFIIRAVSSVAGKRAIALSKAIAEAVRSLGSKKRKPRVSS